jgi:hypothetical protein
LGSRYLSIYLSIYIYVYRPRALHPPLYADALFERSPPEHQGRVRAGAEVPPLPAPVVGEPHKAPLDMDMWMDKWIYMWVYVCIAWYMWRMLS